MLYHIEDFRKINVPQNIVVTMHGQLRLNERQISIDDVVNAIDYGEIIEEYPEDFPFPSCLILGLMVDGRYLHIVVSLDEGKIYLITAYVPTLEHWQNDMKTRRDGADE